MVMRRELPTESHKHAWKNFERILMYRTNFAFFSRFVLELVAHIAGFSRPQKSKKYIEDGKPHNKDFVDATFAYFEVAYTVLMFGRIILLLISTKYLNVTKCVPYYQLGMEFINEVGLPFDRGLSGGIVVFLSNQLFFVTDYFDWLPTAFCACVVQISNTVA